MLDRSPAVNHTGRPLTGPPALLPGEGATLENYLERLQLPDGQWASLLTRLPADRARVVRSAAQQFMRTKDQPTWIDAVCQAVLWEAHLKDYLTGEWTDDYGAADPRVVDQIQARAFILYSVWAREAFPKGKAAAEPATNEKPPSDASPPSAA